MSATMARQGGRVQLEQSNMRLILNMVKMAKGGFLHTVEEEMPQLIKKPQAEVREEKKRGVVFPEHHKVKAAIETHPAMVRENQTDSCLPCQNGTAMSLQTHWRRKGTGVPPPWLAPRQPRTPPALPGDSESSQSSETEGVPPEYVYIYTPLPSAQLFILNLYVKNHKCDKDFIPDLLTDEGPSTGYWTICCGVMQLTSIL